MQRSVSHQAKPPSKLLGTIFYTDGTKLYVFGKCALYLTSNTGLQKKDPHSGIGMFCDCYAASEPGQLAISDGKISGISGNEAHWLE